VSRFPAVIATAFSSRSSQESTYASLLIDGIE